MKKISIWALLLIFPIQLLFAASNIEIGKDKISIECDYNDYSYSAFGCPHVEDYKTSPAKIMVSPLNEGGWIIKCNIEKNLYGTDGKVFDKSSKTQTLVFPVGKTNIEIKKDGVSLTGETHQTLEISIADYDEICIITGESDDNNFNQEEFCVWLEDEDIEETINQLIKLISKPYSAK